MRSSWGGTKAPFLFPARAGGGQAAQRKTAEEGRDHNFTLSRSQ